MDPKEVVRTGYDRISEAYRGDEEAPEDYIAWVEELALLLPAGSSVLDLGCGNGVPVARWLTANGFRVTGVDFSTRQIERARALIPDAEFLQADMTEVSFEPETFDAVVAFYSIIHVPLEEHPEVLRNIASWLKPDAFALLILGHTAGTGSEDDWLGAPMYWSHADEATYLAWLPVAGLDVIWNRFIPEGDGGATLMLTSKR